MEIELVRVLDLLPAMVCVALPDGRFDFVNRRWLAYTGLNRDDALPRNWHGAVAPDDLEGLLERWRSISASGKPGEMEARVRRFDGEFRRLLIECSPIHDEAGNVARWYGVATDVEDRRRAEEALLLRTRDFQSLIDSVPIQVAVSGPSGEIERVNRPTLDYFGKTFEELSDWRNANVVHPDDIAQIVAAQHDALQSGCAFSVECRYRRNDGVYLWHSVLGMPLRNSLGEILRWLHLSFEIEDRKRTQAALLESERKARAIVDGIPGFVAILTPEGGTAVVNERMAEYHGLEPEELKKWTTNRTIHDDDLARTAEIFNSAIASGTPYDLEYRLRRFDGVYRWFHSRGVPLRDPSGQIICWHALQTDIDERKRAEEALAASQRDLQLTIDTIPAVAWAALPDGSADFFNKHYLDYVGLRLEQASGWGWTVAVHPDDLPRLLDTWKAAMAAGAAGEAEARIRRRDGEYRWFLFRANPLRDEGGKVVRWYGVNTDIEDRKQAEQRLRRSEAFLAEGQHLARMGNLSWHLPSGEIVWSEQLYRIFEFEPGSPVTIDRLVARVPAEDAPMLADMVERAQRGESDFEYQHRIMLPDGRIKHLHLIAHRVGDDASHFEYVGAVLDVTQRRLSEEALEKVRSELAQVTRIMSLGVLTASIAHEVNQPLSGIITNAGTCLRMLSADPPNIEVAKETARRTIRDGNRAADIIARLRSLYSKKADAREAVDLNEAAREVLALAAGDLQRGHVIVRTEFADGLPLVSGDRIQLQQVIMNLLRNASDAMRDINDRLRRLRIRTEPYENNHVKVTVEDAGIGLGNERTERVFQAFYTTKNDGMGIGLSVSRSIIENHGGRMWAVANNGPGATFCFTVPEYVRGDISIQEVGPSQMPARRNAQGSVGTP